MHNAGTAEELHVRLESLDDAAWARLVTEHTRAYGLVLGLRRGRFEAGRISALDQHGISLLEQAVYVAEASPAYAERVN